MASFTKLGDCWRAQVRITGHPIQDQTFDTKEQGVKWARDIEVRMGRGVFFDNCEAEQTTFHDPLDCYYSEIRSQKSHPSQELQRVKQWQRHPLAKRYFATLRGTDFAKYRDQPRRWQDREHHTTGVQLNWSPVRDCTQGMGH